jgi:hypothetical protein
MKTYECMHKFHLNTGSQRTITLLPSVPDDRQQRRIQSSSLGGRSGRLGASGARSRIKASRGAECGVGEGIPSPENFCFFISKLHVSVDFWGANYDFSAIFQPWKTNINQLLLFLTHVPPRERSDVPKWRSAIPKSSGQWRDKRIGEMCWNLGVLVTAGAAIFRTSYRRL